MALKIIPSGQFITASGMERLRYEGRIMANLAHDHIVRVYEVGHITGWDLSEHGSRVDGEDLEKPLSRPQETVGTVEGATGRPTPRSRAG